MRIGLDTAAKAGRPKALSAASPAEYLRTVLRDVVMVPPLCSAGIGRSRFALKAPPEVFGKAWSLSTEEGC
jgi:hypothetical protein